MSDERPHTLVRCREHFEVPATGPVALVGARRSRPDSGAIEVDHNQLRWRPNCCGLPAFYVCPSMSRAASSRINPALRLCRGRPQPRAVGRVSRFPVSSDQRSSASRCVSRRSGMFEAARPASTDPRRTRGESVRFTQEPPTHDATHRTVAAVGEAAGVAASFVHGNCKALDLSHHRWRAFKLSRYVAAVENLTTASGLYVCRPTPWPCRLTRGARSRRSTARSRDVP